MKVYGKTLISSFPCCLVNFLRTNKSCSLETLETLCVSISINISHILYFFPSPYYSWYPYYDPFYRFCVKLLHVTNKFRIIEHMKRLMNPGTRFFLFFTDSFSCQAVDETNKLPVIKSMKRYMNLATRVVLCVTGSVLV